MGQLDHLIGAPLDDRMGKVLRLGEAFMHAALREGAIGEEEAKAWFAAKLDLTRWFAMNYRDLRGQKGQ